MRWFPVNGQWNNEALLVVFLQFSENCCFMPQETNFALMAMNVNQYKQFIFLMHVVCVFRRECMPIIINLKKNLNTPFHYKIVTDLFSIILCKAHCPMMAFIANAEQAWKSLWGPSSTWEPVCSGITEIFSKWPMKLQWHMTSILKFTLK